ncbi:MAG: hypothetical protein ACFFCC_16550 [Promethearchaeota archaeon]
MSLWKIIFKNEIRQKTYLYRKNRKSFFIILFSIFLLWALYLGPVIFNAVIPQLFEDFTEFVIPILSTLVEYSFMILFLLYIMYPIFMLYRKSEIGQKDIILATPAKPSDIFLGEFLGQLPFYFLFILGLGPLVNSLLLQLNPNLTILHHFILYLTIFILQIFGLLIGTILSNWLEKQMIKKNKSKTMSNSLFIFVSFLLIMSFYFFHFLFDFIESNPNLKNWIVLYPSYWYSNILLYLIDPLLVETYILNIWVSIGLAIVVPLIIFYIAYKKAKIFYDIDLPLSSNQSTINKERRYFQFLRWITPNRYQSLIITQFKEFFRKKENFPKLLYIGAFTAFLGLFIFLSLGTPLFDFAGYWIIPPYIANLFYFEYLLVMVLSWIGGLIFGIFIGIYVLMESKDIIFLYKKSLRGIKSLFFSFFYVMLYINIFLDVVLTIFFSILFPLDFITGLLFFILYPTNSFIVLMQAIGFQCLRPLFDERGKNIYINIYFIMLLQIVPLVIASSIILPIIPFSFDHSLALIYILLINIGVSSIFGLLVLYLGVRRINKLE